MSRKFPPSTGGMELFAYDLYTSLAPKVDIRLVKWGGSNKALPIVLPYFFVAGFWQLLKGGVDVVHMQDGMLAPFGYILAKIFRKPFVVVIHGLDITFKNPLYQKVIPWFVRRADTVFCISQAAADASIERGVAKERIATIPLAVEDKIYGKADPAVLRKMLGLDKDAPILVTVGRLVKRKGVEWFISTVLPDLVKKYPKLTYVVVGEGGERPNIEAAIEKNNLGQNVQLLGRVGDEMYEAAYNGSDIFVMPNIMVPGDIEGFGLVLLEASLCKLPVVASNTEGIKDAVQANKNGKLVSVGDISGFTDAISAFIDKPAEARKFGEQSRAFSLAHYQWSAVADRYIQNYEKIVK